MNILESIQYVLESEKTKKKVSITVADVDAAKKKVQDGASLGSINPLAELVLRDPGRRSA